MSCSKGRFTATTAIHSSGDVVMNFTQRGFGLRAAAWAAGLGLGLFGVAAFAAQSLHRAALPSGHSLIAGRLLTLICWRLGRVPQSGGGH